MTFVEEMVDCKNSQLSLYKDFDQSVYFILVKQLSLKENMNDKHLSRQEDFYSKDKLNFLNSLIKLKKEHGQKKTLTLVPILDIKKWHFGWPNQNSRATFIVQTFPKYGLKDVDLMNLSFLTPSWPNFNFVDFRAYFGNFSLVKNAKFKSAIPL